jgi:hypothetical protein
MRDDLVRDLTVAAGNPFLCRGLAARLSPAQKLYAHLVPTQHCLPRLPGPSVARESERVGDDADEGWFGVWKDRLRRPTRQVSHSY